MDADPAFRQYCQILLNGNTETKRELTDEVEEVRTAPLFSWNVKKFVERFFQQSDAPHAGSNQDPPALFDQFGVMGVDHGSRIRMPNHPRFPAVFLNTNAPWSAFLCGSQGSGKSHTLSCMLENCLLTNNIVGPNPNPLGGVVFAFDTHSSGTACEAAYLASHIPVTILVSPSNYLNRRQLYKNMPEVGSKIEVFPLFLSERNLNTERMLRLMAFNSNDNDPPLYMEIITNTMKAMAMQSQGVTGFNFNDFRNRLQLAQLDRKQRSMLNLRLQLLESFLATGTLASHIRQYKANQDIFRLQPGHLTIVDLTDPFLEPASCCMLFDICLALTLEDQNHARGRVVALDEAHKFMTKTAAAGIFAESLHQAIREQRHKGVRLIVATQEPTISQKLLDLCTMTFVHRFTSPEWFFALRDHLAGASTLAKNSTAATNGQGPGGSNTSQQELFQDIVNLNVGESLVFAPNAVLDYNEADVPSVNKLGLHHMKFKTRPRITKDGGRSIIASRT